MVEKTKYFRRLKRLQQDKKLARAARAGHRFELPSNSWPQDVKTAFFHAAFPRLFRVARRYMPIFAMGGLTFVTRAEDVERVFREDQTFNVPFGPEMKEMGGAIFPGTGKADDPVTFGLGDDGIEHTRQREVMQEVLRRGDTRLVLHHARVVAKGLLEDSGGEVDAIKDYIIPILAHSCLTYYGLLCDEPQEFAKWGMAASITLFADPGGDPATRATGLAGAKRLNEVIDRSLGKAQPSNRHTLLGRLVALRKSNQTLSDGTPYSDFLTDERIRALMLGLVTGFVPTTTLASGHLLEVLIKKRRVSDLHEAAFRGDRDRVRDIVLEAARLKPAGMPGHFRYATRKPDLRRPSRLPWPIRRFLGTGSVEQDDTVLVATPSALMDLPPKDRPHEFRPGRTLSPNYMFGHGRHSCLGRDMATEMMTEAFALLFARKNIRPGSLRWPRMRRAGPFPYSFPMKFDPDPNGNGLSISSRQQSMLTIAVPLERRRARRTRFLLRKLGNPAEPAARDALTKAGVVHFASMCVVDLRHGKNPGYRLLIEINGDGKPEQIVSSVTQNLPTAFDPFLSRLDLPPRHELSGFLLDHLVQLRQRPWGAIGLNFNGTAEFPVRQIEQENRLFNFTKDIVEDFLQTHRARGNFALEALKAVRQSVRGDRGRIRALRSFPKHAGARQEADKLEGWLQRGREFRHLLFRPDSTRVQLSAWEGSDDQWAIAKSVLKSRAVIGAGLLLLAAALLLGPVLGLFLAAVVWLTLAVVVFTAASVLLLRWHERRDVPDDRNPDLEHIRRLESRENRPSYEQNHITAVNELKSGRYRKWALAAGLFGIARAVLTFRPGVIVDIGTIHQAKWFRLPGTDYLIFQANYDGSWESYLEDFSNKAFKGQNAAWSHCLGFPKTRFMILDGARDGDRFKRWVRTKQVETPFWFSRYPRLTNDQIRTNALVRDGLARAKTNSEARAWLSYFGSVPRPVGSIETEEVQTLAFHGMKELSEALCLALNFKSRSAAVNFLGYLLGRTRSYREPFIAFGDMKHEKPQCCVALSASGLEKLGLGLTDEGDALNSFPAAFADGMGRRGRILGDIDDNENDLWRWSDSWEQGGKDATDAVLLVMAPEGELQDYHDKHLAPKLRLACDVVHELHCQFRWEQHTSPGANKKRDPKLEHFGFQDGVSQPVMRGTAAFARRKAENDVMEPGEFILGYPDNKRLFPPSPFVWSFRDPSRELPLPAEHIPGRFANFSPERRTEARDLGRNGSYLVIRQLEQDPKGFEAFLRREAAAISRSGLGPAGKVTPDWVAAKLMGRWRDGSPLVRHPDAPGGGAGSNDFEFGRDDPQGYRCPHGAHIRRANPRDSFAPGDRAQIEIANRHRILRRGRPYGVGDADGKKTREKPEEKGLLFICLNANIERQFEFIQQTWTNARSFHGLRMEADPLLSPGTKGGFTIPTPNGPHFIKGVQSFVSMKGGGYFFLPSRSALRFLSRS